jgi:hypothetical protein
MEERLLGRGQQMRKEWEEAKARGVNVPEPRIDDNPESIKKR